MQICSNCSKEMPDSALNCSNCGFDLIEWSTTGVALKKLQANPRVSYVRIAVSEDCCPACRQVEEAYAKDALPRLPVNGCSHSHGCRCFYQPVLEEIYP